MQATREAAQAGLRGAPVLAALHRLLLRVLERTDERGARACALVVKSLTARVSVLLALDSSSFRDGPLRGAVFPLLALGVMDLDALDGLDEVQWGVLRTHAA